MLNRNEVISLILSIRAAGGQIVDNGGGLALDLPDGPDADRIRSAFGQHRSAIARMRAQRQAPADKGASVADRFPVHPCQDGLWNHRLFDPTSSANCVYAYEIIGVTDAKLLAGAYREAMKPHAALRLVGDRDKPGHEPGWRLSSDMRADVRIRPQLAVGAAAAIQPERGITALCEEVADESFDVETGPIGAVTIMPTDAGSTIVVETFNHMLVDGRSLSQLHERLGSTLDGSHVSKEPAIRDDQYLRFLSAGDDGDEAGFWRDLYEGFEAPAGFAAGHEAGRWETMLVPEFVGEVENWGREVGASLPALGFAAHAHAVARFGGSGDVCSFVAQDMRSAAELLMFGHATQLLPIRVRHDWPRPLSDHCRDVAILLAKCRDHGRVSQATLRDAGAPVILSDVAAHAFVYQDAPVRPPDIKGTTVRPIRLSSRYAAGGITTVMRRQDNGGLHIETRSWNPDHAGGVGQDVLETVTAFLREIASRRDPRLGDANLLAPGCAAAARAHETPVADVSQGDLAKGIFETLGARPSGAAIIEHGIAVACGDLLEESRRIGRDIERLGGQAGQAILVASSSAKRQVAAFLAVLSLGAVYVPAPRNASPDAIRRVADRSGSTAIVLDDEVTAHQPSLPFERLATARGWDPHEAAYVVFTSGTTGEPKGVVIGRASLENFAAGERERFGLDTTSRILLIAPQEADPWIAHVAGGLLAGGVLVAADPARQDLSEVILGAGVTHAFLPAALVETLEPDKLRAIRLLASAGDHCNAEVMRRLQATGARLFNIYGPTETTISALVHEIDRIEFPVPVGKPISGLGASIQIDGGGYAPVGVSGDLRLIGPAVALGYLCDREKDAADPFAVDETGRRSYMTGDRAWLGSDGLFRIGGRRDRQIKIRGFRVELDGVEHAALASGLCTHARVVVTSEGGMRKIALAYCGTSSPDDVRAALAQSLSAHAMPQVVEKVAAIPLTRAGKPDDLALLAMIGNAPDGQKFTDTGPEAAALIAAWKKVFKRAPRLDDDFFSAGGDSLSVLSFVRELRDGGFDVDAATVYRFSSLETLASRMRQRRDGKDNDAAATVVLSASPLPNQAWFARLDPPNRNRWTQRMVFELDAPASPHAMQDALDSLLAITPALRARYDAKGFHVCESEPAAVFMQAFGPGATDASIVAALEAAQDRLDPATGRLLSAVLVEDRALFLIAHHLAVDDWSWSLIRRRLSRLLACPGGDSSSLDDGAFRHSRWIDALRRTGGLSVDNSCWRAILEGGTTATADERVDKESRLQGELGIDLDSIGTDRGLSRAAVLLGLVAGALNEIEPDGATVVDLETNGRAISGGAGLSDAVGWLGTHHPVQLTHEPFSEQACRQIDLQLAATPDQGLGYMISRWLDRTLESTSIGRLAINISDLVHPGGSASALVRRIAGLLPPKPDENLLGHHATLAFRLSDSAIGFEMHYSATQFPGARAIGAFLARQAGLADAPVGTNPGGSLTRNPFAVPFPASAMQSLMLTAAHSGPDVYRPKAVFTLEPVADIAAMRDRISIALGAYAPFRWRFSIAADGSAMQRMTDAEPLKLDLIEGGHEAVCAWFEKPDHLSAANTVSGQVPVQGCIVADGKRAPVLCLQFHHAVFDGHTQADLEAIVRDSGAGKPCEASPIAVAKTMHAVRRHVAAERHMSPVAPSAPQLAAAGLAAPARRFNATICFSVAAAMADRIAARGVSEGLSPKVLIGAAVLAWANLIGKGDEVWFVVNGRDPDLPDTTTAPGLFWSFQPARSVSPVAGENVAVAADVTNARFEDIRRRASGLTSAIEGVSYNFVAPEREHQTAQNGGLKMSRDLFHFERQVRAGRRADGSLAIEMDFCASIPEPAARDETHRLERIIRELGSGSVNDHAS